MARRKQKLVILALSWGAGDDPPTEFRVFQMGKNDSEKGEFLFDEEAAGSVMRQYAAHGKPLLFDYNHGTTYPEPDPEDAISAGEFIPEVRADGLYATQIKWTSRAAEYIRKGEYRLFSPAFEHDIDTGRVTRLINIALTNLPALNHIAPLMAASLNHNPDDDHHDEEMPMEELKAEILALKAALSAKDTELSALKARLSAFEDKEQEKMSAVALRAEVRKLAGKDSDAEVLGVLSAYKDSQSRLAQLTAQLETEKTARLSAELTAVLDAASDPKAAKIIPAERPGLEEAVKGMGMEKGIAWLKAHLETRVVLAATQRHEQKGQGQQLTGGEAHVAKLLRIPAKVMTGELPPTAMNAASK